MLRNVLHLVKNTRKFSSKVGIIGVPFEKGQRKLGTSLAPKKLRDFGLISQLREIEGIDIKDYGDIEVKANSLKEAHMDGMIELAQVSNCNEQLSKKVSSILNDGRICVTIGGDHSIGIGTVDGHLAQDNNTIVLWIDAHADINTNKTSPSGNIHGMSVGVVLKELAEYWPPIPSMEWISPKLSAKNIAFIGLRAVDDYEKLIINKYNILTFGSEDVERFGIDFVVQMALQQLDPNNEKSIHVSFDIDSLDELEAPSTGTPVRGGLTLREGIFLMEKIFKTGRLKAIDMVEVNPSLGSPRDVELTLQAAVAILKAGLGYDRRGMPPKNVNDIPK